MQKKRHICMNHFLSCKQFKSTWQHLVSRVAGIVSYTILLTFKDNISQDAKNKSINDGGNAGKIEWDV